MQHDITPALAPEGPLLRLEPAALPPPSVERAKAPSLSLRAALSVVLLVGVFVLAVAIIAAGVALNVGLLRLGRVNLGILLGTVAVVAALARAVVAAVKAPPEPPDEVEVPVTDEPGLHEEIASLARAIGTRPPDRVVLVPDVNAYVREFGPMLGLFGGTRTLAIGTPLLDVLTVSQLRAVLAHELGHLAGGDTRLGPLTYRTEAVLGNLVGRLAGTLAGRVFHAYWKLQHRLSAKVRRGQELVADRAAVAAAGRQASADALRTVDVAAIGQELFHQSYLAPLLDVGHRPDDLRSGLRGVLLGRAEELAAMADEPVTVADPHASHPPTAERVRRVAALVETHRGDTDDRAARALLVDPDRLIREVDEVWLRLVTGGAELPVAAWSDWPRLVVAGERTARKAVVDATLAELGLPPGLAGVQVAFEERRERDLAAGLVRAGWRTGTASERDAVLRAAVEAAAATPAVDHGGFAWQLSWSGPVDLRSPAGETVSLGQLVERAVAGDWAPLQALQAPQTTQGGAVPSTPAPMVTASPRPSPPEPPFRQVGPEAWEAEVPGMATRKVRFVLDATSLTVNGTRIADDDLEHLMLRVGDGANGAVSVTVELAGASGARAKARMSGSTGKRSQPVLDTADFLWRFARAVAGPRRAADLAVRLAAGEEVTVGGVVLAAGGIRDAKKRAPDLLPWSSVADPHIAGDLVVVPGFGTDGVVVRLDETDTFVLFEAIPELRARFAV